MTDNLYPCKVEKFATIRTHDRIPEIDVTPNTLAEVKLKTLEGYPKRVTAFGTIYPVGEYWTTLAGPELMRAKRAGHIQEVRQWIRFEMKPVFTEFVQWFWNYRLEQIDRNHELEANLAKLLMNGLYGKFGQKTNAWKDRPDILADYSMSHWINLYDGDREGEMFRNVGQCVQQWIGKGEHPYAFPAIAAYVTSYAREYMLALREIAGVVNCYYIATDALFCNQEAKDKLDAKGYLRDNVLGKLREKASCETATFEALHHYKIGNRETNGSRKKSGKVNPDGSVTEIQFETLEAALKRQPDGSVHVRPVVKRYAKEYLRGYIQPDGWTLPLTIEE
jgi:DNA polymerase elongation subunit (family B)